jgi:hypothetical protein
MADGLSVIASVAGIISLGMQVTQSLVDYYESYKGQKSEVAHTTRKLEHLLSVFGILQQQSTARANEPDLFESIDRSIHDCKEYIHELQRENEKFEENPANGMRAAARTATRRLAYPFRQSTLQKLDEDIDEIVSHRSLALQVLEQKGVGNVQDDIEDVKSLLNLVRAAQVSSNIRQWLKAPDASINYNEACKKKHPGTGLWFVRAPCFSTWLVEPNSFLWLNGFAGCGKSVLCSTAIQHAFRHRRSNTRFGIAFFFFTFNDDSKQNTSAMLRALVLQLSGQLNDNNGPISGLYESYCNFTPPGEAFVDCLQQLVQAFKDVYTILDALDESPPNQYREDVLQTLTKIRAWKEPGLHLLVTSRDATDIREELGASPDETISMKNESVDRDIATFISHHLRDNRRLRKWSEHYDQIETVLTSRAKGM